MSLFMIFIEMEAESAKDFLPWAIDIAFGSSQKAKNIFFSVFCLCIKLFKKSSEKNTFFSLRSYGIGTLLYSLSNKIFMIR